jgi:hypothetical protein
MKDIDVFILLKYGKSVSSLLNEEAVAKILENELNFYVYPDQLNNFFRLQPPKTKFIVHRLKEMGFSPKTIQNLLDINATTVSYHLSRKLETQYRNHILREYLYNFEIRMPK